MKDVVRKFPLRPLFLFVVLAALGGGIFHGCATAPPPKPVEIVWPAPPETPRIRYVKEIGDEYISELWGAGLSTWVDRLLGESRGWGQKLRKPYGVAADAHGRVYIADPGASIVWVLDERPSAGKDRMRTLGGSGQGRLNQPTGVAIAQDGRVFVSDVILDRVYGYDPEGNFQLAIGQKDEFYNPAGLALDDRSKRLYVTDPGHHRIQVYDLDGKFLFTIGKRGGEEGQFNYPTNLFIRGDRLYVTDTMNFRVQIFDLEGKFLDTFGEIGDSLGQFARPKGVAVDSEGHVYVADAAFNNIQVFDDKGRLLLFIGGAGFGPGQFNLPAGMFIDDQDRLYVVDSYSRRVQVFQYLGKRYKELLEREVTRTP